MNVRVPGSPARPRLVVTSRGDALTKYLTAALADRFPMGGIVNADVSPAQRLVVAALTFRPSREAWIERYYKSALAARLRTRNVRRRLRGVSVDVVVQIHALFESPGTHVVYVDCTHRQSAEQWPAWNPLGGRALERWYARERSQYARAAHLFAFSVETADSLVLDYGAARDRVTVVGAGVDFPVLPIVAGTGTGTDALPTVLFIGNDFERKGGYVLLRAFARVRQSVPDARLRIVGTSHHIAPQPGVEVLGRIVDRSTIAQLYAEATVFALPSLFDPFPLVLLEAMAYALPCVSTRTCGVPEIVVDGETGLLTAIGSEDELVDSLLALLLDRERAAALGARGRLRAEERFLWSHVVERMVPALAALTS